MTHDELLAKIDIWKFQTQGYDDTYEVHGILNALRAVVQIHYPLYYRKGAIETKGSHCSACSNGLHDKTAVEYPCSTIKAIEKELQ